MMDKVGNWSSNNRFYNWSSVNYWHYGRNNGLHNWDMVYYRSRERLQCWNWNHRCSMNHWGQSLHDRCNNVGIIMHLSDTLVRGGRGTGVYNGIYFGFNGLNNESWCSGGDGEEGGQSDLK